MRTATVLLNPRARRLRRGPFAQQVETAVRRSLAGAQVVRSGSLAEAQAAVAAVRDDLLVVAGGDGAVNLALNARALEGAPALGLIPSGTANDLARALAISLEPALAAHATRRPGRAIDVLTVNGRRFCTTGGLGLPAGVARTSNRLKRAGGLVGALGPHLYPAVAGGHILGRPGLRRVVTVEWTCADTGRAQVLTLEVYGVLITNVGAVAGRLQLCPATVDDGIFEICLLPARGRGRLLALLVALSQGRGARPGALPVLRARAARIRCDGPTTFFGDGEVLAEAGCFELGLVPRGLRVAGVA